MKKTYRSSCMMIFTLIAGWFYFNQPCIAVDGESASRVIFDNTAIAALSPMKNHRSRNVSINGRSAKIDFGNFMLADYIINASNGNLAYDPSEQAVQLRERLLPGNISESDEFSNEQLDEEFELDTDILIPAEDITVEVKKGESLASIAETYGTTAESIKALNSLSHDYVLNIGQKLKIQSRRIEYTVISGDNLWGLAQKYGSSMDLIARKNGLKNLELSVGQHLIVPVDMNVVKQMPANVARVRDSSPEQDNKGDYHWPATSHRITSPYGYRRHPLSKTYHFHNGIDIAGTKGSPVYAASDGIVTYSGWKDFSGNMIILRHLDGISTIYAHMQLLLVKSGTPVRGGQQIGEIGRTGRATGYHLHFGTRKYGAWSDPMQLFAPERVASINDKS